MWCRPPSSISTSYRLSHVSSSAGYEVTHTAAYSFGSKPLYPVLVIKQVHVERCQQRCSEVLEVRPTVHVSLVDSGPHEPEDGRAAPVVCGMREALQTVSPA